MMEDNYRKHFIENFRKRFDIDLENKMIQDYWFEVMEEKDKEIERLKEELKYTISIVEHNKTIQSNINSYNKLSKYSNDLEDRIEKAIKYMDNTYVIQDIKDLFYHYGRLEEILKGSDIE